MAIKSVDTLHLKMKRTFNFYNIESSSARSIYTNDFLWQSDFSWFSKTNRYLDKGKQRNDREEIASSYYNINVFFKKSDGESFYYLVEVDKILISAVQTKKFCGKASCKVYI